LKVASVEENQRRGCLPEQEQTEFSLTAASMAVAGKVGTIGDGVNRIDVDDDSSHTDRFRSTVTFTYLGRNES
jgi:hypothetical protein